MTEQIERVAWDRITAEEARQIFEYYPETGVLTWKISPTPSVKIDSVAGCINQRGYRYIMYKGVHYHAHRIAWFMMHGSWPKIMDHINGIRDDNRLCNLRDVDRAENTKNAKIYKSNTSGQQGVYWHKNNKNWVAGIRSGKNRIHLGNFTEKIDAIAARKKAEKQFGYHENHGSIRDDFRRN